MKNSVFDNVRINIIGASGTGASTLGRELSFAIGIPSFDSDEYYHAPVDPPYSVQYSAEERYELITREMSPHENWILSGDISNWSPAPELDFTLMIFLYVPTEVRIPRLRNRERERFGDRVLPGGDMHETHEEFIEWASQYDAGTVKGKTLARQKACIKRQSCPVLEFRGERTVESIVAEVETWFQHRGSSKVD